MHEHHCRGCVYAGTGHSYDRKGRSVPRNAVRTRERSPFRGRAAAMQAQRSYASALALPPSASEKRATHRKSSPFEGYRAARVRIATQKRVFVSNLLRAVSGAH